MRLRSLLLGAVLALTSVLGGIAYATAPDALGGSAFPLTYISTMPINLVDGFNEMLQVIANQTVGISTAYPGAISVPSSGTDTSGTTFSTGIQGNPLVQMSHNVIEVSTSLTSASLTTLIASEVGRTIWPLDAITIMASGTAATATGLALECSDGTFIASWPIAALVSNVPVGLYVSSTVNTLGKPLSIGCAASTGLMLSNVGTNITTTTQVDVNVAYTVQ